MLTNDEAVAADAVPLAATWLDEAAGPGDPEDPQPTSGTARTTSATAGTNSVLRRACLIASLRPMDALPSRSPHYSERS
jgi:hypothetical protein